MRTLLIMLGGVALWAVFLGGARLFGTSTKTAWLALTLVWCAVAAANMWIGVTHAGYSIREELPIFLLIFLLPTGMACLLQWKLL
jgi:hypothetical protein